MLTEQNNVTARFIDVNVTLVIINNGRQLNMYWIMFVHSTNGGYSTPCWVAAISLNSKLCQ